MIQPPAPPPVQIPHVVSAPPPTPECVVIEDKLHNAQIDLTDKQAVLLAAQRAAATNERATPDFVAAKADAADKKSAVNALVQKLRADEEAMTETDDEKSAVREGEAAWLAADAKLIQMQNDAVSADDSVVAAQTTVNNVAERVAKLQKSLRDYIQTDMAQARQDSDCPIRAVAIDPTTGAVSVDLNAPAEASAGSDTDVEIATIGHILEKSLCHAAYDWKSAVFTAYFPYNGNDAVQFQASYSRSAVDAKDATPIDSGTYVDDGHVVNLASEFWISPIVSNVAVNAPGNSPAAPFGAQLAAAQSPADPSYGTTENIGGVWYDVLIVGGYRRVDGSVCPKIFIKHRHDKSDVKGTTVAYAPPKPTATQTNSQPVIRSQSAPQFKGSPAPTPAPRQVIKPTIAKPAAKPG